LVGDEYIGNKIVLKLSFKNCVYRMPNHSSRLTFDTMDSQFYNAFNSDVSKTLRVCEGAAGVTGFLFNFGIILLIATAPKRDSMVTLTLSLACSDCLTGIFHGSVLVPGNTVSFLDFLRNEDFMLNSIIKQMTDRSNFWGDNITIPGNFANSTVDMYETLEIHDDLPFGKTSEIYGERIVGYYDSIDDFKAKIQQNANNGSFLQIPVVEEEITVQDSVAYLSSIVLRSFYVVPYCACLFNMFGLSLSLLIIVTKPLKHSLILTKRRVFVFIAIVWMAGVSVAATVLIYGLINRNKMLPVIDMFGYLAQVTWILNSTMCVVLIGVYGFVAFAVNCRRNSHVLKTRHRGSVKVVCTAALIVGSYALFMLPILWSAMFQVYLKKVPMTEYSVWWKRVLPLLIAFNTNVDAFIYAVRLPVVSKRILAFFEQMGLLKRTS